MSRAISKNRLDNFVHKINDQIVTPFMSKTFCGKSIDLDKDGNYLIEFSGLDQHIDCPKCVIEMFPHLEKNTFSVTIKNDHPKDVQIILGGFKEYKN